MRKAALAALRVAADEDAPAAHRIARVTELVHLALDVAEVMDALAHAAEEETG